MKIDAENLPHALNLPAEMDSLDKFSEFIREKCEELNIPVPTISRLALVVEELMVNVVNYAYTETGGKGDVELRCGMNGQEMFCLSIRDTGRPFNPLMAEDPDLTEGIDNRPVGGLGIFLIREMADRLVYRRENGANIILFCKHITPGNQDSD